MKLLELLRITEAPNSTVNGFPSLNIAEVYHVGFMDPQHKRRGSLEGSGLSVSLHPEAWTKIAKLGGRPTQALTNPKGTFLNYHALTDEQKKAILSWGEQNRYVSGATTYRVSWYDDEADGTVFSIMHDREKAEAEAEDMEDSVVKELPGSYVATPLMQQRVHGSADPSLVLDLLSTIFVEDVLGWDGVWWKDTLDPASLSAPRGVIVPNAISRWQRSQSTG